MMSREQMIHNAALEVLNEVGVKIHNKKACEIYRENGIRVENDIGKKADKNRKIYNGMLKTYYYQFLGPKPPKRRKD